MSTFLRDELLGTPIEPEFYAIIKDFGMDTARYKEGAFKDTSVETVYHWYCKAKELDKLRGYK